MDGGTPPPSSSSVNPASSSLTSKRSFKKSDNAQGGQSRVSGGNVNSNSNNAYSPRTPQNGSHWQPAVRAAADAPVTGGTVKSTSDMANQKSAPVVPNASSIQPATNSPDTTAPATLTIAPGGAYGSFPLECGSISPRFMNGMQALHNSSRMVSAFPVPSVPKQQMPGKDEGAADHSNIGDAHPVSQARSGAQISNAPPIAQTQKASVHSFPISMAMPVHQPQVPSQFGIPNLQIQSQGMTSTSLPMPMPLPMGNAQLQQRVFVSGLPSHPIHPQGIMHQGQSLNFRPQIGPQLPPQMDNVGISVSQQFTQQQAGKLGVSRKPVKITHPDTHEELRLDRGADLSTDGGWSHPNVPQFRAITFVPSPYPINYYPNSYNPKPLYFPGPSSVPFSVEGTVSNSCSFATPASLVESPPVVTHGGEGRRRETISRSDSIKDRQKKQIKKGHSRPQHQVSGFISLPEAGSKDKPVIELTRSKSSVARGKKKRKEILRKANAAGTTSDFYMACKGPEGKKDPAASSESMAGTSGVNSKQVTVDAQDDVVSSEEGAQSKAEPDDWEDAAGISTSKLETVDEGKQVHGRMKHLGEDGNGATDKRYSRDFLLKFSAQCTELPESFKISSDIAEALMVSNVNVSRNPRVQTPKFPGVFLSGSMQSFGYHIGIQRNSPDSERWQCATAFRKGLLPSPQTPLQVIYKAEKKYEIGKVTDEEQAKQRQLKAIINKLTPQNFEEHFEQVKAVNIDCAVTLTGVISQIFDKALMEPTFCEMYANFCFHLAGELPDFIEDNEKITFKRLLLNKCQEEFERGERDQEEADRADQEGDVKQSKEEREEKRNRVRRRMLGNIKLIGELCKKKMLTERIMHEWIKKLLGQCQNPEENIEALCKLMGIIGVMTDHPKAKEHMDAYFDMMTKLSNNMKLLRDATDLRKNKWQQRRKVDGSKGSVTRGKKKRKEILRKANAAETTSDLYMAYKDPEGKKEPAASSESMAGTSSVNSKQVTVDAQDDVVSNEEGAQSKKNKKGKKKKKKGREDALFLVSDWEDAADISNLKLETVDEGKQVHGRMKHLGEDGNGGTDRKCSRDFLLKFSDQCTELPESFEILSDIAEALMVSNFNASLESYPSPGRSTDRPSGRSRRGVGVGDDEEWSKLPGPPVTGPDHRLDDYGGNFRPGQGGELWCFKEPTCTDTSVS